MVKIHYKHILTKRCKKTGNLAEFFRLEVRKIDSYKITSVVFDFEEIKMSDKRVPGNT